MSASNSGSSPPAIVVCGSINMDLVVRCDSLPLAGQTITAESANEVCGGKGANQAVAASKAGGRVQMIGRVGSDAFAEQLVANLKKCGVDCGAVHSATDCGSGLAIVAVENSGQNSIMLVAGANGEVSVADVQAGRELIEQADMLLLQLEVPTDSVIAAIGAAKQAGVRCILDPAPVAADWTDELLGVDLVCPNETEASEITGVAINTIEDAKDAAKRLQNRGAKNVAITLGQNGVVLLTGENFHHIEATSVQAVDTTAAGDAFAGALGVRWAETNDLVASVRFASIAGAIAATRHGAQPSLPTRNEIEVMRNQAWTS